jgi:hypothetical protein
MLSVTMPAVLTRQAKGGFESVEDGERASSEGVFVQTAVCLRGLSKQSACFDVFDTMRSSTSAALDFRTALVPT